MQNFRGLVTAGNTVAAPLVCLFVCVLVTVSVWNVNSGAQRAEISLWLYLVNAVATDKSFISLIRRYKPCRACCTLQFTHCAQHKDTATSFLPPSFPLSSLPASSLFFFLSWLSPPPPPSPPSSGHSRQYVSLTLANQRFTLDAQMERKGNQSTDTWGGKGGLRKKKKHFLFHIILWLVFVLGAYQFRWPVHAF